MRALLILSLLAGLGGSVFYGLKLQKENQADDLQLAQQSQRIEKLEADLKKARLRLKSDFDTQKQVVDDLKSRLKQEQDTLAQLELDRARAHNGGVGGDDPHSYNDLVAKQQAFVAGLNQELAQNRAQQKSLQANQARAFGSTQQAEVSENQQLSDAILAAQANLRALNKQIKDLMPQRMDFQVGQQIQQLRQQASDQSAQLQVLKEQRQGLAQQRKYTDTAIVGQVGAQMKDLKASETLLKQRVQVEQAELDRISNQQKGALQSRNAQRSAISQLDKAWQDQKAKVSQLSDQLKNEEARLEELNI